VLSNEVDDTPATIPLLHVRERERRDLRPAQAATEKYSQDGAVAKSSRRCDIRRVQRDAPVRIPCFSGTSYLKAVMAKVQIGALATLISAIPGLAADTLEWGQPVSGLRLSISIQPSDPSAYPANPAFQVTLENVSDQFLLVPIGALAGNSHPMLLKMYATTSDGKTHSVLGGFGLAGGGEPLIISLQPQGRFTVQRSISSFFLLDDVPADLQTWPGLAFLLGPEKLETLMLRPCQLWVELEHESAECVVPNFQFNQRSDEQVPVPCWHGKVATNILRFPN
jgi:hypothetical protein